MTTIWLNHWFSTAYNIVNLIKEGDSGLRVICSNEHDNSPIKAVCDEWFIEPALSGEGYIDFCLDFCRTHDVDIFIPRRHIVTISEYKKLFADIGVLVMVDDFSIVKILNNKADAYREFSRCAIGRVPDYRIATNTTEFKKSYSDLSASYDAICFKFVRDEGGKSYRRIDNNAKGYNSLFKKKTTRVTFDEALGSLSVRENFPPLMVMPYLPGDEISIDCLKVEDQVLAIPRVKNKTRVERIRFDDDLVTTCEELVRSFCLEHPCNVQFKILDGTPYLLEINTRMSGGVHMSCAGCGVNIPYLAINKLLGRASFPEFDRRECYVTQVEVPIVL